MPGEKDLYFLGPMRCLPGKLSVCRTFGDIESKNPRWGGNPKVVICDPEIVSFKLEENFDFLLIGCDGIFENLSNRKIIDSVWNRISQQTTFRTQDAVSSAI